MSAEVINAPVTVGRFTYCVQYYRFGHLVSRVVKGAKAAKAAVEEGTSQYGVERVDILRAEGAWPIVFRTLRQDHGGWFVTSFSRDFFWREAEAIAAHLAEMRAR